MVDSGLVLGDLSKSLTEGSVSGVRLDYPVGLSVSFPYFIRSLFI